MVAFELYDAEHETALMRAARLGHLPVLRLLLQRPSPAAPVPAVAFASDGSGDLGPGGTAALRMPEAAHVDLRSNDGWTALHFAAGRNKVSCLVELLHAGASIEARDNSQRTPLHVAAWNGCMETLNVLLDAGASTAAKSDGRGRTALAWAVRYRRAPASITVGKARAAAELRRRGAGQTPDVEREEKEAEASAERDEDLKRRIMEETEDDETD